jgi:hypothetical protein
MKLLNTSLIGLAALVLPVAVQATVVSNYITSIGNNWKIEFPCSSTGSLTSGSYYSYSPFYGYDIPSALSPYCYKDSTSKARFVAPSKGLKTSSAASGTRAELREQYKIGSDSTNWKISDKSNHTVRGTFTAMQFPSGNEGKMIIGQIHGYNNDYPLLKLQIKSSGSISVIYNTDPTKSSYASQSLYTTTAGTTYRYVISVKKGTDGLYTVSTELFNTSGTRLAMVTKKIDDTNIKKSWLTVPNYFKAGVYNQYYSSSASSSDKADVRFADIYLRHW